MRTREEIEEMQKDNYGDYRTHRVQIAILTHVLLDIRDLLSKPTKEELMAEVYKSLQTTKEK